MKRKILIVEDNVGLSQIQKDWLSQAGYEAATAMNAFIKQDTLSLLKSAFLKAFRLRV